MTPGTVIPGNHHHNAVGISRLIEISDNSGYDSVLLFFLVLFWWVGYVMWSCGDSGSRIGAELNDRSDEE